MKKINDEVLYATEDILNFTNEDINSLIDASLKNPGKRCRVCTHKDPSDIVHEMIIVHTKDTYVRPHKHIGKPESFHVIKGFAKIVVFDDDGKIIKIIEVGDYNSGKSFYYKIEKPYYHTLIIESDIFIFHETTLGPFDKEKTVFAPWSPDETKKDKVSKFIDDLSRKIGMNSKNLRFSQKTL